VTNDLERRIGEHNPKDSPGFTAKYGCTNLVYYETTENVHAAIEREKQIKGWLRKKKLELIIAANPTWRDLSADWPSLADLVPTPADPSLSLRMTETGSR
jgi:putative endonuclease